MGERQFFKLPASIAAKTDITCAAKVVYAYLSDRQGDNGHAWPSMRRIAADCGINTKAAVRATRSLEAAGLITVVRPVGNPSHQHNNYAIVSVPETGTYPKGERTRNGGGYVPETGTLSVPETGTDSEPFNQNQEPDRFPERDRDRNRERDRDREPDDLTAVEAALVAFTGHTIAQIRADWIRRATETADEWGEQAILDALTWAKTAGKRFGEALEYAKSRKRRETWTHADHPKLPPAPEIRQTKNPPDPNCKLCQGTGTAIVETTIALTGRKRLIQQTCRCRYATAS